MFAHSLNKNFHNRLGLALILISSVLLGIWAVKGTIALRNILLGIGTLLSIVYCYQFFRCNQRKISIKNWVPIIMLGLMFCWVVFHYLLLSRFPDIQLHELKSTWFRTFLAAIVGFGTGLAIIRRPNAINCLWLGIFASFAYLFYQYLPLAIGTQNINYHGYETFIYPGKISGVLAGTILIAGLLGTILDRFSNLANDLKRAMFAFWLLGTSLVLYAEVYIFDSRNGVGLAVIIFSIVALGFLLRVLHSLFLKEDRIAFSNPLFMMLLIVLGALFAYQQFKMNSGWSTMAADVRLAVKIDQFPNWQDPRRLGYPQNSSGKLVTPNTYERVAWATAGATIFVPENLLGVGILSKPFGMLLNEKYPDSGKHIISTHSAWIDLALAFGIPALALTLGALVAIMVLSITSRSLFRYLSAIVSLAIILLYTVGEVSSQHGIEILYFWITLLTATLFSADP